MGVETIGPTSEQLGRSISKWVQDVTIDVAEKTLVAEVGKGFDNQPEVITDGVLRRDFAQVKPFGKIEFVARANLLEIVQWIMAELFRRSPVKTGRYRQSHVLRINETIVAGNWGVALQQTKGGDKISVVNTQPYARKLEGATANKKTGRGKRKPTSRQAPGGIYRPTLRALLARWGKTILADYTLVHLTHLGVKVWGDQGGRYKTIGKGRTAKRIETTGKVKRVQRDQVYPAIVIKIRPSQTLH